MIPRNTDNLNVISALDDRPNDVGGLSADALKNKFDQAAGLLKDYLNNILLPFLESASAAADIGVDTIPNISSTTLQGVLEELEGLIENISQGSVAPGAIDTLELKDGAVTEAKIDDGAVTEDKIDDGAVTEDKIDDGAVTASKIGDGEVGAAKLSNILPEDVGIVIGDHVPTTADIGPGQIYLKY